MRIVTIGQNDLNFQQEFDQMLQDIEKGLDAAATEIKARFLEPTIDWKHKPEFTIESAPLTRTIGTDDENYARINFGTIPHVITAKGNKFLKTTRKNAKTRPYSFQSQGDGGEGQVFYAKRAVNHPGIAAREWEELIYEDYSPEYNKSRLATIIQEAINSRQ